MAIITQYECDTCCKRFASPSDTYRLTVPDNDNPELNVGHDLCKTCLGQVQELLRMIKEYGAVSIAALKVST